MEKIQNLFLKIRNEPIFSIAPLKDGISNDNYLINRSYVLRVRKEFSDPFYCAENEAIVEDEIKDKNICSQTLYFNKMSGEKLTKYISDSRYLDIDSSDDAVAVAKKLKLLHGIETKTTRKFAMFDRLKEYRKHVPATALIPKEDYIVKNVKKYERDYLCLCHNDVVRGNLLFTENELFLIDFEYAGLNSAYFDLASFITENNITNDEVIKSFLSAYFGPDHFWDEDKFKAYCQFLDLLWYYWAYMFYIKTAEHVYLQIINAKLERLNKL